MKTAWISIRLETGPPACTGATSGIRNGPIWPVRDAAEETARPAKYKVKARKLVTHPDSSDAEGAHLKVSMLSAEIGRLPLGQPGLASHVFAIPRSGRRT